MKTKKNNGKNGTALIGIALILLCLAAVSGSMLSGIMAKYTITATSSDSARVAAFHVRADLSKLSVNNVVDIFAGPENPARYLFDAEIDAEVTTKYSVEITINNKNENYNKGWPEGLKAKLEILGEDGETWSDPIESTTGKFTPKNEDDWVVPAGTTKELSFALSFETSYTTIGGTYDMAILVIMEQQD